MLNFLCFFVLFIAGKTDSKLTLIYRDKTFNLEACIFEKFLYHKEIMGWTSGFPEITETSNAH